jgi:hypothetical protein
VNSGQFEDGAHRTARNHAGAGRGGLEHHAAGADLHRNGMRDRLLDHRHGNELLARLLDAFADCFGDFAGLADGKSDLALLIAHDDER